MPNYPDSFKTEVAERNSIEDVVAEYVTLSKRSGSNRFGLCPFHNEKTPSFSVSPSKQIFHCFGCGKGGDVITFIREIEGLSYPEALEFLARRAGIPIPVADDDAESKKRARMYALNKDAARFYYERLVSPAGAPAQQYVMKRQISKTALRNFGLGFAPDTWSSLRDAMHTLGYSDSELFEADLIRKGRGGGFYDTFRNRLMFPVIDTSGRVIGFSGRILGDGEPKYLNTRETLVFNKGRNLFGLNLAKKSKAGYIILVEGNVDVVSLHQAGFDSAVASLGTALTDEQARIISRYTQEVILAYDSDGAGVKAAQRGIKILEKLDVKVKILRWEGAKDPDEYIKLKGAGAFRNLIEKSESQMDFRLLNIKNKYDITIPEQKVDYLKEATNLVAGFPGEVERQVYAAIVAEIADVAKDAVIKEVENRRKRLIRAAKAGAERDIRPEAAAQPPDRALHYENPKSAVGEEGIVRLLFLEPSLAPVIRADINPEDFTSDALRHIYETVLARIDSSRAVSPSLLSDELSTAEMSLLVRTIEKPEDLSSAQSTAADYIRTVKENNGRESGINDLRTIADSMKNKGKGYKT